MERLKKKYADNPEELKRVQGEFIREQGIEPFLGCLPMFLQMPIWIALWQALQTTFELRLAPFLRFGDVSLTWIKDLSKPDALITFPEVGFWFFKISAINVLPVLLGVVSYIQQSLQPKPAAITPEQQSQQKMMKWMVLLFPIILYSGPSGLNLYILTSTAIGIIESKRIRDHLREQEEAEKEGKVIVDAPTTRAGRRLSQDKREQPAPKKGLAGWLESLKAKAEQMQRESEKKNKKKGR
jgi:YidC/Oxa1 family membrane protein insertase